MCDELGNSTLKITTRQTLQLHGILKNNLRETIKRINDVELSTLAACGDVNRNIMCCPAKRTGSIHAELEKFTDDLTEALAPQTPAYHELWITDPETGEKALAGGGEPAEKKPVDEPLYGPTYLPRKFKVGICLPEDNCIDLYTQDLGFIAVVREGKIIGYNVTVGGGMGRTPSAKKTFAALAKRMAFVTPEQAIGVSKAVLIVQRDNGNRADRKTARMKYLIGHAESNIEAACDEVLWSGVGRFGKHLRFFKKQDVKHVTMAGKLFKSDLLYGGSLWLRHLPDLTCVRTFGPLLLGRRRDARDDRLLNAVIDTYHRSGLEICSATSLAPELLVKEGNLTRRNLPVSLQGDAEFGFQVAKTMGGLDIGQAVAIKDGTVIAVEAIEGTD
ncbi:unnamed protein product, partial [Hapterophycus canaliculatus]